MPKRKPERLVMAVVTPPRNSSSLSEIRRYYIDSSRVDSEAFAATLKSASLAGKLSHVVTQSTGFGWRTVWEIANA